MDFFLNERIFKVINNIMVTLILKISEARAIKDYRAISYCTTIYKIISKILTTRLGRVIASIVNKNQIVLYQVNIFHDHILLDYELIRGYSMKGGISRCMMQLDLQKAWREAMLPNQYTKWIMLSVTIVSYWFNINCKYIGSMQARRGLRQGDPISPMLASQLPVMNQRKKMII